MAQALRRAQKSKPQARPVRAPPPQVTGLSDAIEWPVDQIEHWPIERLAAYDRNANTHPPEQVAQIVAAMREFGWTIPVLVREDGTIAAGHGRIEAARQLELAVVPVMVARGWSEEKFRRYVIADNKLAANSVLDLDMLRAEMADIMALGVSLDAIGYTSSEFDVLMRGWSVPTDDVDHTNGHISSQLGLLRVRCTREQLDGVRAAILVAVKPFPGVEVE
jgi:ParB-like nuclease domain